MKNETNVESSAEETKKPVAEEQKVVVNPTPSSGPNYWLVGGVVALILVIAFGFFAFVHIRTQRLVSFRNNAFVDRVYRGGMGMRGFGGSYNNTYNTNEISGKVTAVNGSSFIVDVAGTSKTVAISSTTRFPLNSATKVNVGDNVDVWGLQDSSGVIQADRIAVNPTY